MDHADSERSTEPDIDASSPDAPAGGTTGTTGAKRRRGSRGGQRRRGSGQSGVSSAAGGADDESDSTAVVDDRNDIELPEPIREGRPSVEAAERALVRKPRIGDTMPMPTSPPPGPATVKPVSGRRPIRWHPEASTPVGIEGRPEPETRRHRRRSHRLG